jgi:hypothetical protein
LLLANKKSSSILLCGFCYNSCIVIDSCCSSIREIGQDQKRFDKKIRKGEVMGIQEILLFGILMGAFIWTFYRLLTDKVEEV